MSLERMESSIYNSFSPYNRKSTEAALAQSHTSQLAKSPSYLTFPEVTHQSSSGPWHDFVEYGYPFSVGFQFET